MKDLFYSKNMNTLKELFGERLQTEGDAFEK